MLVTALTGLAGVASARNSARDTMSGIRESVTRGRDIWTAWTNVIVIALAP